MPYVGLLWGDYVISKKYELNPDGSWKAELQSQSDDGKKIKLADQFKSLFANRPAVIVVIGIFIMYIVQAFRNSSAIYVFNYYFELPDMLTVALTSMTVASIVGALAMKPFIKIVGDSNRAYVIWSVACAAVYVAFWALCTSLPFEAAQESLKHGLLFWLFILGGFFQGAYYNFAYVMLPMAVDYGVWKFKRNQSGFIYAFNGFALTAASSVGIALLGIALSGIGYEEGVNLTSELKSSLIFIGIMVPSLLTLGHAVIQAFFGLNDKKYKEILAELQEGDAVVE